MTKRDILGYLALALGAATAAGVLWYIYFVPSTLRVAVGPSNSEPTELLAAMSAAIERDNASVRLVLIPFANLAETSAALDAHQADLAVVRTDLSLPTSGLGVAIVHQYIALVLARPQANIRRLTDLRNHSVGVVGQGSGNIALFETLMASYGLTSGAVRVVPLTSVDEIAAAIASGRIDALFVTGPRGGRLVTQSFHAFSGAIKGAPVFVPIGEAAALVARNPVFAVGAIAPGELGITPLMPAKEVQTLTFPALLVASNRLASKAVQEFTRELFSLRHALLAQNPAAGRIEKLSTDRGESFAVHPGAATYYDAEEPSLLSGLSDWFWVGMLGLGGLGSMGA
jgi:NMT1-like family